MGKQDWVATIPSTKIIFGSVVIFTVYMRHLKWLEMLYIGSKAHTNKLTQPNKQSSRRKARLD